MTKIGPQLKNTYETIMNAPANAAIKVLRNKEIVNKKAITRIDWLGKYISSPENRLIMGVTALVSQPFIDLNNKDVDESTRIVSCAKTLGKIIAGTTTGVLIRHLTIKLATAMSRTEEEFKLPGCKIKPTKFNTILTTINHKPDKPYYNQYRKALGTFIGIGVMLITNFAIDMPLTNFLTNFFTKKFKETKKPPKDKGGSI